MNYYKKKDSFLWALPVDIQVGAKPLDQVV